VRQAAAGSEIDIVAVALALWELSCPGQEPRLSVAMAEQLRRSAGQLDRINGPGDGLAAVAGVFEHIGGGVERYSGEVIETLAYVVGVVKAQARAARRHDRHRRGLRDSPAPRPWRPREGPA
jgi:hypothetical protein